MTKLQIAAAILATFMAWTAHAKDDPETAALKAEWRAAKKLVAVSASPGLTASEAHDIVVKKFVSKGGFIKTDSPYQVVAEFNIADEHPVAASFVQALAGDPSGGAPIARVFVSFIEENGEPVLVRYCARIVMTNRYGGEQAGDCTEAFKNWRRVTEDLRSLLTVEPVATEPAPVEPPSAEVSQ